MGCKESEVWVDLSGKMKKMIFISILFILATFTGCDQLLEDPRSDRLLTATIEAIQENDVEKVKSFFAPEARSMAEFENEISQIFDTYDGERTYWKKTWQHTYEDPEQKPAIYVECEYLVQTLDNVFIIQSTIKEIPGGSSGWISFKIMKDNTLVEVPAPTGFLREWRDFNSVQWLMVIISIIVYVLMLFTFIHCLTRKVRFKPLFLILIPITLTITIASAQGHYVYFMYPRLLYFSNLMYLINGQFTFNISVPVGVILYWIFKVAKKIGTQVREGQSVG